jgi:hypothetical protein
MFMSDLMFQVGDRVLRADVCHPQYLREGIVIRVIRNREGIDALVEYVIDYGIDSVVLFENDVLRPILDAKAA